MGQRGEGWGRDERFTLPKATKLNAHQSGFFLVASRLSTTLGLLIVLWSLCDNDGSWVGKIKMKMRRSAINANSNTHFYRTTTKNDTL